MMTTNETPSVERLMWAYGFDGEGTPKRLDEASAIARLMDGDGGFLWVHLGLANARAREWLADAAALPPDVRAELLDETEQFQIRLIGDHVAGALPDTRRDIGAEDDGEIGRLRFAFDGRVLVTARRTALRAVEDAHAAAERGKRFEGPAALLGFMIGRVADGFVARRRALAERLDRVEDHVVHKGSIGESGEAAAVRRGLLVVHRRVQALSALLRGYLDDDETKHPLFDDIAERLDARLAVIDRDLLALLDRARAIQDEISGRVAAASNRSLQALSIMTALFVPATLISSIFGMNTGGFPWKDHDFGTLYAALLCVSASLFSYVVLRMMRVVP